VWINTPKKPSSFISSCKGQSERGKSKVPEEETKGERKGKEDRKRSSHLCSIPFSQDDVDGKDDARDVEEKAEDEIDPEVLVAALLEENSNEGKEDGDDDECNLAAAVCHFG